jgi:hypothetical protein
MESTEGAGIIEGEFLTAKSAKDTNLPVVLLPEIHVD